MKNDWNISWISNGISNIVWILGSWVMDFICQAVLYTRSLFFSFLFFFLFVLRKDNRKDTINEKSLADCLVFLIFFILSHAALTKKKVWKINEKISPTKTSEQNRNDSTENSIKKTPSFLLILNQSRLKNKKFKIN